MHSLQELSAKAAATTRAIEDVLSYALVLPRKITSKIWKYMEPHRLRELEILVVEAMPESSLVEEIERQWRMWLEADDTVHFDGHEASRYFGNTSDTIFLRSSALVPPRLFRMLYWERRFRNYLKDATLELGFPLKIFNHAVKEVKIRGNELTPDKVERILIVESLHRIEVHHVQPSELFWSSFSRLVMEAPQLQEICILHSKLNTLAPLLQVLNARARNLKLTPIDTLEFVSIKMTESAAKELSAFASSGIVRGFRVANSIPDSDDRSSIVVSVLNSATSGFLQFNDLEDEDVPQDATSSAIQRLSLGSNSLTRVSFLKACTSLIDLDLSHNELGDSGITSFATDCIPNLVSLTRLVVYSCRFYSPGATALLAAVASSKTLEELNIGRNYLGNDATEILVPFLNHNTSIKMLHLNCIGLGGISSELGAALHKCIHIRQLSIGENRLRDAGISALVPCLPLPLDALDLSGNLITAHGLQTFIAGLPRPSPRHKRRNVNAVAIGELNLRDNLFPATDLGMVLVPVCSQLPRVYSNEWQHHTYDDKL